MRERERRVVRRAPGQRGVDVGALGAGEGEVLGLAARCARPRVDDAGRGGEPRGVRVEAAVGQPRVRPSPRARRRGCCRAAGSAARAVAVVDDHERTAREPPDHVDRRRRGHVERLEDGLDRRQRRAAGERRQRPQAPLVVGEQQLVAPADRRPERPAALRLAAGRVAQHAEAVVEAAGDLRDRQRPRPRRGELDRQRQAVERPAQLAHVAGPPVPRRRAAGEQLDGVGERERRELEHDLAVDAERDLARAEDPEPGGGVEEALRQRRGRVDDVLAVVEDHHARRRA